MDLMQWVALMRRNSIMISIVVLLGGVVGAGISLAQPEMYSAQTTGYVVAGNSST